MGSQNFMANCQWPECRRLAAFSVRTIHVATLYLCPTHRDQWHDSHYLTMVYVSANRQKLKTRSKPGIGLNSPIGVQTIGTRDNAGNVIG